MPEPAGYLPTLPDHALGREHWQLSPFDAIELAVRSCRVHAVDADNPLSERPTSAEW
jgi:hypothetical protein